MEVDHDFSIKWDDTELSDSDTRDSEFPFAMKWEGKRKEEGKEKKSESFRERLSIRRL